MAWDLRGVEAWVEDLPARRTNGKQCLLGIGIALRCHTRGCC
jgi:hypothetical protein